VLVIARLDRLARSVFGYADLLRWCEADGKSLVSVSESLDFSTAVGRACAISSWCSRS
jgi:site-specific DNA recombinase